MKGGEGRILDYRADGKAGGNGRQKPEAGWARRLLCGLAAGGALALTACGGSAYSSLPWSANTIINRECGSLPGCRIFTLTNMMESASDPELRDGVLAALREEAGRNPEAIRALGDIARMHPEYRERITSMFIDIYENDTEERRGYADALRAVIPREEDSEETVLQNSLHIHSELSQWRTLGWGRRDAAISELGGLLLADCETAGRILPVLEGAAEDDDENVRHMAREAILRYAVSETTDPQTAVDILERALFAAKNEQPEGFDVSEAFGQFEHRAHGREGRAISALSDIAEREPEIRERVIDILERGFLIGETHSFCPGYDVTDMLTSYSQGEPLMFDLEDSMAMLEVRNEQTIRFLEQLRHNEASAMTRIALMDGVGRRLRERVLGVLETAVSAHADDEDGSVAEDTVFLLGMIATSSHTDDGTRGRIARFLLGVAGNEGSEIAIRELVDIGADARTDAATRHDIVMALLRRIGYSYDARGGVVTLTGMDCADSGGIINGITGMLPTEDETALLSVVDVLGRIALRDSTGSDVRNGIARAMMGELPRIARLGGDEAMETFQQIIASPDIDPEIIRILQERMEE